MLVALSFVWFAIGFIAAVVWVAKDKKTRSQSLIVPDTFSVVIDRLKRHSPLGAALPSSTALRRVSSFKDGEGRLYTKLANRSCGRLRTLTRTRKEVEAEFDISTWQRLAYEDLKSTVLAKGAGMKTFPCIYATMGYRSNDHRYLFLKSDNPSEPQNVRLVGPALEEYLNLAPSLGANTSLVIISAPSDTAKSVEQYNGYFWDMLRGLRIHDPRAWPEDVPSKTASEKWTFCYNNEAVFPVMLTPAHTRRYSRHMSVPVIALQPKWVLDKLLATPEKREAATLKVRRLLKEYDSIEISPDLSSYGEPGTTESAQLCLGDANVTVKCPYEDFDM